MGLLTVEARVVEVVVKKRQSTHVLLVLGLVKEVVEVAVLVLVIV